MWLWLFPFVYTILSAVLAKVQVDCFQQLSHGTHADPEDFSRRKPWPHGHRHLERRGSPRRANLPAAVASTSGSPSPILTSPNSPKSGSQSLSLLAHSALGSTFDREGKSLTNSFAAVTSRLTPEHSPERYVLSSQQTRASSTEAKVTGLTLSADERRRNKGLGRQTLPHQPQRNRSPSTSSLSDGRSPGPPSRSQSPQDIEIQKRLSRNASSRARYARQKAEAMARGEIHPQAMARRNRRKMERETSSRRLPSKSPSRPITPAGGHAGRRVVSPSMSPSPLNGHGSMPRPTPGGRRDATKGIQAVGYPPPAPRKPRTSRAKPGSRTSKSGDKLLFPAPRNHHELVQSPQRQPGGRNTFSPGGQDLAAFPEPPDLAHLLSPPRGMAQGSPNSQQNAQVTPRPPSPPNLVEFLPALVSPPRNIAPGSPVAQRMQGFPLRQQHLALLQSRPNLAPQSNHHSPRTPGGQIAARNEVNTGQPMPIPPAQPEFYQHFPTGAALIQRPPVLQAQAQLQAQHQPPMQIPPAHPHPPFQPHFYSNPVNPHSNFNPPRFENPIAQSMGQHLTETLENPSPPRNQAVPQSFGIASALGTGQQAAIVNAEVGIAQQQQFQQQQQQRHAQAQAQQQTYVQQMHPQRRQQIAQVLREGAIALGIPIDGQDGAGAGVAGGNRNANAGARRQSTGPSTQPARNTNQQNQEVHRLFQQWEREPT